MSAETAITAALAGNVPLMAILTGGVYAARALPINGIDRKKTPDVYDADGYPKPHAVVKGRELVGTNQIPDPVEQFVDTLQVVEVWLYQNTGSFDDIDAAVTLVYTLLHEKQIGGQWVQWVSGPISLQDPERNLNFNRLDFAVTGSMEGA